MKIYKAIKLEECQLSSEEFYNWYSDMVELYNILTIEDLDHFFTLEDIKNNKALHKEILDIKEYVVKNDIDLIVLTIF